jgi:hypothetical protein
VKLSGIPAYREFTATRRSRHELIADPREGQIVPVIFGRGQTAGTILVEK